MHGAKDVGTRTVNLLMGEHAGEYIRGDIMDANAVIQAFDEIKGSVDTDHDSLEEHRVIKSLVRRSIQRSRRE